MTTALVLPAFHTAPEYVQTLGPEVAELSELTGLVPDGDQRAILDDTFGLDRFGRTAAFESAVVACRQNIKTATFKMTALGWLYIVNKPLVIWSAHEFNTAQEAFRDMCALIEAGGNTFTRRVKKIYYGNGDESIEMLGGQRLKFKARTQGGGRGLTGDGIILDEAYALMPMHMGALMPTLSTVPDPQIMYGSSAGQVKSAVLRDIRDRGRVGDPSLAYTEFSVVLPGECAAGDDCDHHRDAIGCRLDDRARWARANPAMGRRISVDYIAKERRSLPPAEFARERLGWWDDPPEMADLVITEPEWTAIEDPESAAVGAVVYAVDVDPDGSRAAIAVAGGRADDLVHTAVGVSQRGTKGFIDRCKQLDADHGPTVFVIDGRSPAAALQTEMEDEGLEVVIASLQDVAQASMQALEAVKNRTMRQRGQAELTAAVLAAQKRDVGDGQFVFSRKSSEGITEWMACVLAMWGHNEGLGGGPNLW